MYFEIRKTEEGQFYFVLTTKEGPVIATSEEEYETEREATIVVQGIIDFFTVKALSWVSSDEPTTETFEGMMRVAGEEEEDNGYENV